MHPRLWCLTYCIGKSDGGISSCNSQDILGPRRTAQAERQRMEGTMWLAQTGSGGFVLPIVSSVPNFFSSLSPVRNPALREPSTQRRELCADSLSHQPVPIIRRQTLVSHSSNCWW